MLALAGKANARLFLLIGHPELSIGHSEFAGCRSSLFEQTGREIPDDQTPTHGSRIGPRIRARFGWTWANQGKPNYSVLSLV